MPVHLDLMVVTDHPFCRRPSRSNMSRMLSMFEVPASSTAADISVWHVLIWSLDTVTDTDGGSRLPCLRDGESWCIEASNEFQESNSGIRYWFSSSTVAARLQPHVHTKHHFFLEYKQLSDFLVHRTWQTIPRQRACPQNAASSQ